MKNPVTTNYGLPADIAAKRIIPGAILMLSDGLRITGRVVVTRTPRMPEKPSTPLEEINVIDHQGKFFAITPYEVATYVGNAYTVSPTPPTPGVLADISAIKFARLLTDALDDFKDLQFTVRFSQALSHDMDRFEEILVRYTDGATPAISIEVNAEPTETHDSFEAFMNQYGIEP